MRQIVEDFKLYPVTLKILAGCFLILYIGMTFVWPLNTIYMTKTLGHPIKTAGIILMLFNLFALIGNISGGYLFDKWGGRKSIILGIILSTVIVLLIGLYQDLTYYAVLLMCLGFCNGLIFPSVQALAVSIWPEGGRKAVNIIYVAQNLGIAMGAALGGVIADISVRLVFFSNAITYVIFLILFIRFVKSPDPSSIAEESVTTQQNVFLAQRVSLRFWISLSFIGLGFMLCWMVYSQWASIIPLHTQNMGLSLTMYSTLWTVNGLCILLGQPLSNWFIEHITPNVKTQAVVGVLFFSAAMVVIAVTQSYWGLVLAMLIMTFGEMLAWPAVPTLVAEITPKKLMGRILGITAGAATIGRMMGPIVGATLFEALPAKYMFLILSTFTVLAFVFFLIHDRFMKKKIDKPMALHEPKKHLTN